MCVRLEACVWDTVECLNERPEHTALRRSNEERKWYQRNVLSLIQTHKPRPLSLARPALLYLSISLFKFVSFLLYLSHFSPVSTFFILFFLCLFVYQLPSVLFSCSLSNATHTHSRFSYVWWQRQKRALRSFIDFFPLQGHQYPYKYRFEQQWCYAT